VALFLCPFAGLFLDSIFGPLLGSTCGEFLGFWQRGSTARCVATIDGEANLSQREACWHIHVFDGSTIDSSGPYRNGVIHRTSLSREVPGNKGFKADPEH
jgi:hypothetical protein